MDNTKKPLERNSIQILRDLPPGARFRFTNKQEVFEVTENDMEGGDVRYNQDDGFGNWKKRFDEKKSAFIKVVFLRINDKRNAPKASPTQN